MNKVVAVSGGFDPIHIGHIELLREASEYGELVIILNSDAWLQRKKKFVFMLWAERAKILEAIKYVSRVEPVNDSDNSVCEALNRLKIDVFANGGDRDKDNILEYQTCHEKGIKMIFDIGGEKLNSSSELVRKIRKI